MSYHIKAFVGVSLFLACIAGFCVGLFRIIRSGATARGSGYAANGIPAHVGWLVALLATSVVLGLGGLALAAARGDPPAARPGVRPNWLEALGLGLSSFGLFFLAAGATALLAAFGPGGSIVAGVRMGMGITGGVFVVMGLVPLVLSVRWALSDRRISADAAHGQREPAVALPLSASIVSLYETANLLGSRRQHTATAPDPPTRGAGEQSEARESGSSPSPDAALGDPLAEGAEPPGPAEAPPAPEAPLPP